MSEGQHRTSSEVALPHWLRDWPTPQQAASDAAAMNLAVAIARENVVRRGGGPFGAVLRADADHRILSLGVNLAPTTGIAVLHAEVVALLMAGQLAPGSATLFTSSEPCIMCLGAAHWANVTRVVSAALRSDAEAIGFVEGEGCVALETQMRSRGVRFESGLMRAEAVDVFRLYAESGGPIYGPKRG